MALRLEMALELEMGARIEAPDGALRLERGH